MHNGIFVSKIYSSGLLSTYIKTSQSKSKECYWTDFCDDANMAITSNSPYTRGNGFNL